MSRAVSDQLRALYKEGRLIPFVGAGISTAVRWSSEGSRHGPSWRELVDQACNILGFDNPELLRARGTDLQILEYFVAKRHGPAELTTWLTRELDAPDHALRESRVHAALAGLSACHLYYTTNYDNFLERALTIHGRHPHAVAIEAHIGEAMKEYPGRGETCEVVKFHGDLWNPDQMVLSESNYEDRLQLATILDYRLRSDLLGRSLLFLGYSFRDPNVAYIFRRIKLELGDLPGTAHGHRAYIAVPEPSDFEYTLFRRRNIEVIPIGATDQASDIATLLEEIAVE